LINNSSADYGLDPFGWRSPIVFIEDSNGKMIPYKDGLYRKAWQCGDELIIRSGPESRLLQPGKSYLFESMDLAYFFRIDRPGHYKISSSYGPISDKSRHHDFLSISDPIFIVVTK